MIDWRHPLSGNVLFICPPPPAMLMLLKQNKNQPKHPLTQKAPPKASVWVERRVWLTAIAIALGVGGLQWLGTLQSSELSALDWMFRLRPVESVDKRIVIVSIDDQDIDYLRSWPIADQTIATALKQINAAHPRAIGLDIYRDIAVGSGQAELQTVFETTPNLIGIEKIQDATSPGIQPPDKLNQRQQIGFNNVVVDSDSLVRRALLLWTIDGQRRRSFALQLAMLYLDAENLPPIAPPQNPSYLKLGHVMFPQLQKHDGGYADVDVGGYQILANPRAAQFPTVSLKAVLTGQVSPEQFRDRIVLIGSTAESLKDFFYTSYSQHADGSLRPMAGVELHANFISQLLSAVLDGRSPLRVPPLLLDWGWIFGWSLIGAIVSWRFRYPVQLAACLLVTGAVLTLSCYLSFVAGWWIPLVPPMISLTGSALVITSYIAYLEEELKKSKEFLNSVINTIPDPIFVKDQQRRWVVLNDAFCRFVGHPREHLLEQTDEQVFSPQQASCFRHQDDRTFKSGLGHESEEEFTNASGDLYLIATKRSRHRDRAGNVFLVGVIRDITQRKQVEADLRRTTAELEQSNVELKQAEHRLRHLAYHDSLTGLPNRELFEDRLRQSLHGAVEHQQLVAVLFLDLDGFKQINDTYGHAMGNLLLKAVAQRLLRCLRNSDTVARFGGDEFVVLLPTIPQLSDVLKVAEKILSTLSRSFALEGIVIPISTSIGISICPLDGTDTDELLKKADLAMYLAKQQGKNQYVSSQEIAPALQSQDYR